MRYIARIMGSVFSHKESHPYWYEYSYDGSGNRLGMVERDGTGNIVGQP